MIALPPPEILARLAGPQSTCVIQHRYTDEEAGHYTTARCDGRRVIVARDQHGVVARRASRCSTMILIEGVQLPRLLRVSNCTGVLRISDVGDIWTRQLLAAAHIAPYRLENVLYEPVAHRQTCYRISIGYSRPGPDGDGPLKELSAVQCERAA